MKNLLLLTDFSDNAYAAAQYAAKLAPLWGIERVVLYHTYEVIPTVGTEPVVISNLDILEEKQKISTCGKKILCNSFRRE
ncbi:hypothetical protein KUH03_18000 [Sphingobacterium sp. E70]|uniref:hypothetical protein n=1 Tax=Sphingobacterium sp. E70 TaxID=2853439 RepID=UPI00211B95D3|nr:hypothetical protein [Sphingobacterium sp. E70]ULT28308.1 hypothetical protein KUH03_18000 [Sphingobacterium sp. E70]